MTPEVPSPWEAGAAAWLVYALAASTVVALLLALSSLLGARRPGPEKDRAYESGIVPTGTARSRYPVPFFLVAVFFLVFDVEAAFIWAWAAAFRPLGAAGWLEASVFILVMLLGLAWVWRKGGLDWLAGMRS